MVFGLLGLVLLNGLAVFWAPPVPLVQLDDGSALLGQLAQRRIRPGSPAQAPRYERQYQVGLRELNGHSYVWVDEAKVRREEFPPDVLGLERMENGPAFVRPVRLTRADGRIVEAGDGAFAAALSEEVALATEGLHLAGAPTGSRIQWLPGPAGKVPVDVYATGPKVIALAARAAERVTFAVGSARQLARRLARRLILGGRCIRRRGCRRWRLRQLSAGARLRNRRDGLKSRGCCHTLPAS